MDLKAQIHEEMKDAMRSKDTVKLNALRMLIAEIKKREIDKKAPLDQSEIIKAVSTQIKQRLESIEAFKNGGRQDLLEKEQREASILQAYLPAQLSKSELETLVKNAIQATGATGPQDIGKVMKAALSTAAGRADGKLLNELTRTLLVKQPS